MELYHYPLVALMIMMVVVSVIVRKMPLEKMVMLLDRLRETIIHFTQLQHFKNLIYLMLSVVICYSVLKGHEIPEGFWAMYLTITGVYFNSKDATKSKDQINGSKGRREEDEE